MINEFLQNTLRKYQAEAFQFMSVRKSYILQGNTKGVALEYDDMGLGKTLTTLCAIQELEAFPCIIVVPKFGLMVWQDEIRRWLGYTSTVYSGTPKEREAQWKEFIIHGHKFLITNYAMLSELASRSGIVIKEVKTALNVPGKFKWGGIIWDEAHMGGIFNHTSMAYKVSLQLARIIPTRYVLTGTPFRQGCVDLYAPLSLLDPVRFDSYWKFVNKYCTTIKTPFGKTIERNPANISGFRSMLTQYMVRRVKDEVLTELPGKLRQTLFVSMNAQQKTFYDELTASLIAEVPDTEDLVITPNQMTLMVRQRQILACPQVLGLKERGAAIDTIIEHSHLSLDENKPIVVFTPFRKAIQYLSEAFKQEYPTADIFIIQGQMSAQEFGDSWHGFQQSSNMVRILLCVVKSGASFSATSASVAYFLGYEWDFNLNEQCEDRLYRMGQKDFVNIYYVMSRGTVDEAVATRLNEKKSASNWVVGSDEQYLKMLIHAKGNRR